jgi:hypothetical protein
MPNTQRQINHELFFRNNFGTSGQSPQMMAGVAVVVFNSNGVRFATRTEEKDTRQKEIGGQQSLSDE